jgi:hypothetical protein
MKPRAPWGYRLARFGSGKGPLAALVRQQQDLLSRRSALYTLHRENYFSSTYISRIELPAAALKQSIAEHDRLLDDIEARLKTEFPEYAALANPRPLSIGATQEVLSANEAVVQFLEIPGWQAPLPPEETLAWFITKTEVRWVRIPLGPVALAGKVQALRCGLDYAAWRDDNGERCAKLLARQRRATWLPFDTHLAYELYHALFGEAEDLIRGKHLFVIPSATLSTLPFAVLVAEKPTAAVPAEVRDYSRAAWLAKRQAISVLPGVASIITLRKYARSSAAANPFIGFGNPLLAGVDGKDKPAVLARRGAYVLLTLSRTPGCRNVCKRVVAASLTYVCFLRCGGGFQPITTSARHRAFVSSAIKKSARAATLAGRARAVGVTKYNPPSGRRQSARTGSSCPSAKYWVAINSGSSVIASPSSTVGNKASALVPRSGPVGVIADSSPVFRCV